MTTKATSIFMPPLGPTLTEAKLAKWLKHEGDNIKSGDILAEIETDKATMEVEAVDDGKLGKILIAEGTEGVPADSPIALLLESELESINDIEPEPYTSSDSEEFTTDEWEETKIQALRQIIEANLDTPEQHLSYIRDKIASMNFRRD